jgi:uncharacterized protein YndB with AHSA1/START domain
MRFMTMTIDVAKQIGAVTRSVVAREHEGKPAHVIVASQTYPTTAEDLWDAITSAERVPRWLLPLSGELRRGGRYRLEGNAEGTILVCDRPRHLKLTWEYSGKTSWVDARIEPAPGVARLTIEHLALDDEHWTEFGPGAGGVGWDLMILGLERHLAGGMRSTEEGMQWMMSDEGKAFMRQSSSAWYHADVAGGEEPEAARAAADRTLAAYSGS